MSIASSCRQAAVSRGLSPESVETIVVLGAPSRTELEALLPGFPGLRRIVLVTTRPGAGGVLANGPWRCSVTALSVGEQGSPARAYFELAKFCLGHHAALGTAVVIQDDPSMPVAAVQGIADLFLDHGRGIAERLRTGSFEGATPAFVFAWADHLLADARALHALRLYDAMAQTRRALEPALAVRLMQAWCALEQPARALDYLEACGMPEPQAKATAEDLRAVADEQAAAERVCWAANAEHLARHFPALFTAMQATPAAPADLAWMLDEPWRLDFADPRHPIVRQEYPVLVPKGPAGLHAVVSPRSAEALHVALRRGGDVMQTHAIIGDVVQFDALLNVLANPVVSKVPHRRQVVYGIVPDLARFRRFAEVQDLRGLLLPHRIEPFWGDDAAGRCLNEFRTHRNRPIPEILIGGAQALRPALDEILRERVLDFQAAARQVAADDTPETLARVRAKIERGEPLRIWTWSSKHTTVLQYVARDLEQAFTQAGHRFEVLIEADARDLVDKRALQRSLADFRPDVLLFLDRFRSQFADLLPKHLPSLAWFLDEIPQLRDPATVASQQPHDLTFAWSPSLTDALARCGYPHVATLPFAANPDTYGRNDDDAAEEASVAFITHLSLPPDETYAPGFVAAIGAELARHAAIPSGWNELRPLVEVVAGELGVALDDARRETLICIANAVGRHHDRLRIAETLQDAGVPLACYGRGWAELPRFAAQARGLVPPGDALRRVYRRHKVVLHINIRCNMHPRVLEGMLAGGFVLARSDGAYDTAPGGIAECFDLERELCLFSDLDDLVAKARRAFTDEPWRRSFIVAGRERVLGSHTYRHRAEAMLAELRRVLLARPGERAA